MSELSLALLLAAEPAPFRTAAAAWRGLADDLDNGAEELIRGTRDLEHVWPLGTASQAAHTKTSRLRTEVSNAYNPALRISQALNHHAEALVDLRQQAESLVAAARQAGLTVDPAAGTVTAKPEQYQASAEHTAKAVTAYTNQLSQVLGQARALDDSTANAIRVNLPQPDTGFGALQMPPVSRQDVENQRGRPPKDVNAWWNRLTPQQQEQALRDHPDLLGWLDGIPSSDRDVANRTMLDRHQANLQQRADSLNQRVAELLRTGGSADELERLRDAWTEVNDQRAGLDATERKLNQLGDKGLLLGIDPAGDGKAIIAVGNPDTATSTAVWVPGTGTELTGVGGNVNRVLNLQKTADGLTPEAGDVAAIMWLGYDAPEWDLSVAGNDRSQQGGAALDSYIDGLRATHETGAHRVTAIGHSYGSTVVADGALAGNGLAVNDIVTAGSPGMHTDKAEDLHIDPRHVWAGHAEGDGFFDIQGRDPVSRFGPGHGQEPHDEDFGGNRYEVDTRTHSDYWKTQDNGAPTESLLNQGRIIVGQYGAVGLEHGKAPAQ